MLILGIESSCDETAAALVEDGIRVLSTVTASTQDVFSDAGGVVPEDAARRQLEYILPVLHAALKQANVSYDSIDAIAVTRGPGLLGSLLVGTTAARTIAMLWGKPLIGVHHTFGHLCSTWIAQNSTLAFPIITLSVSGGHTDLWYRTSHMRGKLIGRTRDDAAGEAFDKGASMLGLPYPGGPSIAKAAQSGDERSFDFPKPLHSDDTLDFSYSGLKTALKYIIRDITASNSSDKKSAVPVLPISDLAASYQYAICAQLIDRVEQALKVYPDVQQVHIVGGVSANTLLRSMITNAIEGGATVRWPVTLAYCTDNAAMIASAGYFLQLENPQQAYEAFLTSATIPLESVVTA